METTKNFGLVYLLSNPAMPGIYKIGKTSRSDIAARMKELYSTGVPTRFECVKACRVENCTQVEKALHQAFAPNRINPEREFFRIEPEQVLAILELLDQKDAVDVTAEVQTEIEQEASDADKAATHNLEQAQERSSRIDFANMGIPVGAHLQFARDSDIEVEVADTTNHVRYHGELTTLSSLTKRLVEYIVRPTGHWFYNDRNSLDIYNETFKEYIK